MKNNTCYLYECTAEFHVRKPADLANITPGCTFCISDTEPKLIGRYDTEDGARKALSALESNVRVYDAYAVRGYNVLLHEYWISSGSLEAEEGDDDYEWALGMIDCTRILF